MNALNSVPNSHNATPTSSDVGDAVDTATQELDTALALLSLIATPLLDIQEGSNEVPYHADDLYLGLDAVKKAIRRANEAVGILDDARKAWHN
jgi:hypothetical protein